MTSTEQSTREDTGPRVHRVLRAVASRRRWPTVLALLVVVAPALAGLDGGPPPAAPLTLLPAIYVVLAAVGRQGLTWPLVLLGLAGYAALTTATDVDPRTVVLSAAAVGLVAGLLRHGHPGRGGRRELLLQGAGLAVFGTLAVLGTATAPGVAVWLLAAGWLGHGVWDFVHLHRDAVVSRTFAEWCGVVDVLVAAQLVWFAGSWSA